MKRLNLRPLATAALIAALSCAGVACSGASSSASSPASSTSSTPQGADSSAGSSSASGASNSASGDASATSGGTDTTSNGTSATSGGSANSAELGANTSADGTPLLEFQNDEDFAQLVANMQAGKVPTSCNVLYDQMGSRPDVTLTDPAAIARVYELVQRIRVVGESQWSITDSYHHVIFTLQDGTKVGIGFEGEGNLVRGRQNYLCLGDSPLWSYVRQLQDGTASNGQGAMHPIYVRESQKGLVVSCPEAARAGELVALQTVDVDDGDILVRVDNMPVAPDSLDGTYSFVMPDQDVLVEVELFSYDFGS